MAHTPALAHEHTLSELASRFVKVRDLPWKPTPTKGIYMKILMEEPESGLLTALFRWQPGTELPLHEHVEIEQTYVLSGSFSDHAGTCTAGNYVWRKAGSRHEAWTDEGCLVLAVFLKPNIFFD